MHKMAPAVAQGLLKEFTRCYERFVTQQCAGREGGTGPLMVCVSVGLLVNDPDGVIIEVGVQYHEEGHNPFPSWMHVPTGWFVGARDHIPVRYVECDEYVPLKVC